MGSAVVTSYLWHLGLAGAQFDPRLVGDLIEVGDLGHDEHVAHASDVRGLGRHRVRDDGGRVGEAAEEQGVALVQPHEGGRVLHLQARKQGQATCI